MKKLLLLVMGLLLSAPFFAQRTSNEKETVQHLVYPNLLVPGAKTVSVAYEHNISEDDPWAEDNPFALNPHLIKSLLTPLGYELVDEDADLNITLLAGSFFPSVKAVDASSYNEAEWYQPRCTVPRNWVLKLEGAIAKNFELSSLYSPIEVPITLTTASGAESKHTDIKVVEEIIEDKRC